MYTTAFLKKAQNEMAEDNKDFIRNIADLKDAISKHEKTIQAAENNISEIETEITRLYGNIETNKWNIDELTNAIRSLEGE